MTAKELIKYLQGFDPDKNVMFICCDIKNRIKYEAVQLICITDAPVPCLIIEIDGSEPFDAEEVTKAEECERGEE